MKLFGLASYDAYERSQDTDTDFSPEARIRILQDDEAWQTYEEVRLSGELEREPIEWTLGGYYLHEDLDVPTNFVFLPGSAGSGGVVIFRPYSQGLDSLGGWGGSPGTSPTTSRSRAVCDTTTSGRPSTSAAVQTIGGVVRGRRRRIDLQRRVVADADGSDHPDLSLQPRRRRLREVRARLQGRALQCARDRGTSTSPPGRRGVQRLLGGGGARVLVQAAGSRCRPSFFYYRYENYQVFLFVDSSTRPSRRCSRSSTRSRRRTTASRSKAASSRCAADAGADSRGSASRATSAGCTASTSISRRSATVQRSRASVIPVPVDFSGNQLQNAPEYKVERVPSEWTFDLGRYGYLMPRYDVNWSDDVFFDPNGGGGSSEPTGAGGFAARSRSASGRTTCTTCGSPTAPRPATSRWPAGSATSRTRPTRTSRSTRRASRHRDQLPGRAAHHRGRSRPSRSSAPRRRGG